jgi:hypothetical protein
MDSLNLNIEDYELNDILRLFKVNYNFGEDELKRAKKMVLQSHPDKSKLDKKYFIFFSKAYKQLYYIYSFKNKEQQSLDDNLEQENLDDNDFSKNKIEFANSKKFNEKFNKLFESNRLKDEFAENGYGEWLKSEETSLISFLNEHFPNYKNESKERLTSYINEFKKQTHELVEYNDLTSSSSKGQFSHLNTSNTESYESDMFSNFKYEDLRKAYNESIIRVTDLDKPEVNYNSVEELLTHRNKSNVAPLSLNQAKQFLAEKSQKEELENTDRAFFLAKQWEESKLIHQKSEQQFRMIRE